MADVTEVQNAADDKAAKKAGTEEICFTHSPVKYHRTKEQFILAPTHDEHPCKAAYIVVL